MIDYPKKKWARRKKLRKKAPLSQIIKRSIISLIVTLTLINSFLLVLFMIHNSDNSQKGYVLKQSQEVNKDLQFQQKLLEAKLIEFQKFSTLQDQEIIKQMEAATEDSYQFIE